MTDHPDKPTIWPSPEEMDAEEVRLGFITEEQRIERAYQRIFKRALERYPFRKRRS